MRPARHPNLKTAIFVPSNSLFYQYRARLAELAAKTRLPAMWGLRENAEAGGLMAYSSDLNDLARRAATFVDKILRGAKPADLPGLRLFLAWLSSPSRSTQVRSRSDRESRGSVIWPALPHFPRTLASKRFGTVCVSLAT